MLNFLEFCLEYDNTILFVFKDTIKIVMTIMMLVRFLTSIHNSKKKMTISMTSFYYFKQNF